MRFEGLDVSKRAAMLSADVYKTMRGHSDSGFQNRLIRPGLSLPSNIAEGFASGSHRDCIKFLHYPKGSCGELRTHIYIGMDVGYIDKQIGPKWARETEEISLARIFHQADPVISNGGLF